MFQNPYASLNPRFTSGEILTEPMRMHGIGADEAERRALADGCCEGRAAGERALQVSPRILRRPAPAHRHRARLTLKPELLICDEAVSALDVSIQAQLLNLLQELQDEYAMSYLFISHDLAVVKSMADEVMVMKDGEVVEMGSAERFIRTEAPLYWTSARFDPGSCPEARVALRALRMRRSPLARALRHCSPPAG